MAIRIDSVKSSNFSDDKTEFLVVGSGKYVGEVKLIFARECLDSLIDARWPTDGAGSVARKRLQMTVTRLRHALEPVAEVEIGRLDELRSVALEGRIEADVQLVRHAEVMSLALA